ncbi:MAG: DNA mismatch repair endonuclease MutL, partial [Planctomycetota bacterium]
MIRVLEPEVINQIAAGEVIERPFSVLKELLENSLDAGAERIEVEIQEGGRDLVSVRDDAAGFSREDLELAFVSHATSKLSRLEDLNAIVSLGFRGEALASIGSVSRARILSRAGDADSGAEVRAVGGRGGPVSPAAAARGTIVEVRDLFYNVPARRRFLKSPQAERARCLEVFTRLALAHPDTGFQLAGGGRTLRLLPGETLSQRVGKLFGGRTESLCLPVRAEREGIRVAGLAVDPDGARRDRSQELLFLNGRPIKDRSLSHAIAQAYRDYLMGGKYPVSFLFLTLDPREVDVNVHPTKAEVRFHRARLVYSVVHQAVRAALGRRQARLGERTLESVAELRPRTGFPELPAGLFGAGEAIGQGFGKLPGAGRRTAREARPDARATFRNVRDFLVVRDLYVVFETDDGIAIVDQHALHERVIYEKLLRGWREGKCPVQRLLLPAILELAPADKDTLLGHREELGRGGLVLSDFGGGSIKLEGYPAALKRVDPKDLVDGLLRDIQEHGPPREPEELRERLHSAACRSAVMAGDRLGEAELRALLRAASSLEHPDNCPHGRPTVL